MTRFLTAILCIYTIPRRCIFPRLHVESASGSALSGKRAGRRRPWKCLFMISLFTALTRLPSTGAEEGSYHQHIREREDGSYHRRIWELQKILIDTKGIIEKSDALVYAPVFNNIPESCSETFLKCYLLDLEMILQEEKMLDVTYDNSHNIRSFIEDCSPHSTFSSENCLPCESEIVDTTIFIERLDELLKAMMSEK